MHPNHVLLVAVEPLRVKAMLKRQEALLVDVREADEWYAEHIPGAIHMPLSRFEPSEIPDDEGQPLILHCLAGARSSKAAEILFRSGRTHVMHMRGGLTGWKLAGLETIQLAETRRPA